MLLDGTYADGSGTPNSSFDSWQKMRQLLLRILCAMTLARPPTEYMAAYLSYTDRLSKDAESCHMQLFEDY